MNRNREYKAIPVRADDVYDIINLGRDFIGESHLSKYALYNEDFDQQFIGAIEYNPDFHCIMVCTASGEIAGYALLIRSREFFVGLRASQPYMAEIYQFYVAPHHRRSRAASVLRDACHDFVVKWQCWACQAGSASGINDNAVLNLWGKIGYNKIGSILFKEY